MTTTEQTAPQIPAADLYDLGEVVRVVSPGPMQNREAEVTRLYPAETGRPYGLRLGGSVWTFDADDLAHAWTVCPDDMPGCSGGPGCHGWEAARDA